MPAIDEYYARKLRDFLAYLPHGCSLKFEHGRLFVCGDWPRGINVGEFLMDYEDTPDIWFRVRRALDSLYEQKPAEAEEHLIRALGWKGTMETWHEHQKKVREAKKNCNAS